MKELTQTQRENLRAKARDAGRLITEVVGSDDYRLDPADVFHLGLAAGTLARLARDLDAADGPE